MISAKFVWTVVVFLLVLLIASNLTTESKQKQILDCNQTTGAPFWAATRPENWRTKWEDPKYPRGQKTLCAGHQTTWLFRPMARLGRAGAFFPLQCEITAGYQTRL
jgi:hypothetical protein